MQRLPTNVRMVLAASSEKTPLEELAALADKIMEVAVPSIATAATQEQATREVDNLCAENASLWKQISALQAATVSDGAVGITEADIVPPRSQVYFGTTVGSGIRPETVLSHARSWETDRPATSGDEFHWLSDESPFLCV